MLSLLFKNTGAIEAVARGCNWLTYVCLPIWLSPQQFGSFSFLLALVLLVSALGTAGQDRVILRYVGGKDNPDQGQRITIAFILSLLFSLLMVGCFLAGISYLDMWNLLDGMLPAVILWIVLQSIYMLLTALARAKSSTRAFSIIRAGYGITKLVSMCSVAAWTQSVEWLVITEAILLVFVVIYGLLFFFTAFENPRQKQVWRRSIMFGLPLVFHILAGASLGQLDKLMVGTMLDETSLGIYAFINSIAGGVFFVFAVINIVYEAKVYQLGVCEEAEALLKKMITLSIVSALGLLLLANLALPFVLDLLNKGAYYNKDVMLILSIAYLIYPLYLQSNVRFALKERTRYIPVMTGLAAITNILLNLFLIPRLGIVGAAYSTLGAYVLLVMIAQWTSRKV